MRFKRKDVIIALGQLFFWLALLTIQPLVYFFVHFDLRGAIDLLGSLGRLLLPLFLFFTVNYYLLVPKLFFRGRKWGFFLVNNLFFVGANTWLFAPRTELPADWRQGFYIVIFVLFVLYLLLLGCALGLRYVVRWSDAKIALEEERGKNAEAELAWLKNQLNPHFFFNTLNNISSLVRIDTDLAQESIGQLSDLLRYAIYDSNRSRVPLADEVDFMDNYVRLMSLRYGDKVRIETEWQLPPRPVSIAPLLFISLIENAFKHGVNNRKESFVRIVLRPCEGGILFLCANSLLPKTGNDRIGTGIGLENLRRRLELLYPGGYRYSQETAGDCYRVEIVINKYL